MSRFNKVEVPTEFIMNEVSELHEVHTEGIGMAPLLASKVSIWYTVMENEYHTPIE